VDALLVLQIGTGIFWSLVYVLIIRQGFKDKATGMPLAALSANIAWEFIYTFISPHGGLQGIIDIIWLSLDSIILIQYIKYGRKESVKILPGRLFYPLLFLSLSLSFLIIMAIMFEFNDWQGKYAAFGSNLMMSILFISLLIKRGNTKGQSIMIAFCKMIGSFLPGLAFYIYFRSGLLTVLSAGILIFDLIYMVLLECYLKAENNPVTITSNGKDSLDKTFFIVN
jgi:hypothetical protein